MSAELVTMQPMSVIERAARALSKEEVEIEIKQLVAGSKSIMSVTDTASREVCHESLMVLKNMRIQTEKRAKKGRDEAVQYSKAVIAIEKELVALIEPEETRLAGLRDEWDSIKERERQARIDAEVKRVADIQERIVELRGCQTLSPSSGSALLLQHLADLEAIPVDDSFEEFRQSAADAKEAALYRLSGIHAAAVAHEAEQERIKAEREELAKLRAEAVERDRLARAAQEKADAEAKVERDRLESIAKAERDAESARQAEANRLERQRIAQEEAAARVIRDAEDKRLADERAAQVAAAREHAEQIARERAENDRRALERAAELDRQAEEQRKANAAEAGRIAAERAAFEAEQAAAIEASKPKPKGRPGTKNPGREAIVQALAERYSVDAAVVRRWLKEIDWEAEAA
jgi:hypothetical protein